MIGRREMEKGVVGLGGGTFHILNISAIIDYIYSYSAIGGGGGRIRRRHIPHTKY